MKISVCMPTLNTRPQMLKETVDSIQAQTHTDWELLVNTDPVGIFVALNRALAEARGDILYFACDDDPLVSPGVFETVNARFEDHGASPHWIYGRCLLIDESGGRRGTVCGQPVTMSDQLLGNRIPQPAAFINRAMYETVGPFNEQYRHSADYDYWLRCWDVSEPEYVAEPIGCYRAWNGSHTAGHRDEQCQEVAAIRQSRLEKVGT